MLIQQQLIASPVTATVDFAAQGVHHGFLRLPYSRDDAARIGINVILFSLRGNL